MKVKEQQPILETRDLSIGYRKKRQVIQVLSGINTAVSGGELVAVIGVNGVGKSTFLRTVSGVQAALEGMVRIDSQDRTSISDRKLALFVSLVLSEQPVSRNLTVRELVALGRQPYSDWLGALSVADREQVDLALQQVDLQKIAEKRCHELSDGQFQKVLISRALAQDTPLMILDEPTAHLDLYHKAQVLKLLKNLTQETGKAIVFATHEINLALQLCDTLIVMTRNGTVQGSPGDLVRNGVLDSLFPTDFIQFDSETRSFRIKS